MELYCSVSKRDVLDLLHSITKQIKALPAEKTIECSVTISNTGLAEIPMSLHNSYREFIDLGGRQFDLSLILPNTKTMAKELRKKNKQEKNGTSGNQK
jgi:hypothetical protein